MHCLHSGLLLCFLTSWFIYMPISYHLICFFKYVFTFRKKEEGWRYWFCGSCWIWSSLRSSGPRSTGGRGSGRWAESDYSPLASVLSVPGILGDSSRDMEAEMPFLSIYCVKLWNLTFNLYFQVLPLNVFHSSPLLPIPYVWSETSSKKHKSDHVTPLCKNPVGIFTALRRKSKLLIDGGLQSPAWFSPTQL